MTQLKRVHPGQQEDSTPAKRACPDPAEIARTIEMARNVIKEMDKGEAAKRREVHNNRTEPGLDPTCPTTGILADPGF